MDQNKNHASKEVLLSPSSKFLPSSLSTFSTSPGGLYKDTMLNRQCKKQRANERPPKTIKVALKPVKTLGASNKVLSKLISSQLAFWEAEIRMAMMHTRKMGVMVIMCQKTKFLLSLKVRFTGKVAAKLYSKYLKYSIKGQLYKGIWAW